MPTSSDEDPTKASDQHANRDGQIVLDFAQTSLAPLAEAFRDVAETYGLGGEADQAMDRLFAFTVMLRGAGEDEWRAFGVFTINEAIARRDAQNEALGQIQIGADPWLRKLQMRANRWAETELSEYVWSLPDDWFRFRLSTGQTTAPAGVKENCLHQIAFGVVALTSFDFADEADIRVLYVPVQALVPIDKVLALAGATP